MLTWLPRCFALLSLVLPFVPVMADDPGDKDIARLVKQLGSSDFRTREAARKQLEAIGEPTRAALRKAAASGDDVESRRRASALIQTLNVKLQVLCYDLHSELVSEVAFSPGGRHIISASHDGTVRLIEASTGKLIHCLAHPRAQSVAISPDGKTAISTSYPYGENQTLRLWDLKSGKELKRLAAHGVCWVAFSVDGKQVRFGAYPGLVYGTPQKNFSMRSLDIESGKETTIFEGPTAGIGAIALSADGTTSLSGSSDGTVRLWDNETGKELKRFEGHKDRVIRVALSKDGKRAVSGGMGRVIKLWDLETGKEIRQMEAHAVVVHGVAFSSDGRRIASAGFGHTISLWDAETGEELHRFEGHTDDVMYVAFSPDGRFLVSGSRDRSVRVWRVPR